MEYRIPFNKADVTAIERAYAQDALCTHTSGIGPYTLKCEALLEQLLGAPRVLLTSSGTAALEIAAALCADSNLRREPGGFVIVPSFTHPSTANAFLRYYDPLFVDIDDTLNMDTANAGEYPGCPYVPVHYAGVACELDRLPTGSVIIEDAAHALFGTYKGKLLGTIGKLGCLSFHETKHITCGEGGALIINDAELIPRAEIIRDKGTDRSRFLRGEVDRYTWQDVGSSYVLSDVLAGFLWGQLQRSYEIGHRRAEIWNIYDIALEEWSLENGVRRPTIPCTQPYHMYYLLMPTPESRTLLIDTLKAKGILAVSHFQPLHLSPMGQRFGGRKGQCPVAEWAAERIVRLPFYNMLTVSEQDEVIETIRGIKI